MALAGRWRSDADAMRLPWFAPFCLAACAAPGPLLRGPNADAVLAAIDAAWRGHIAGAQQHQLDAVVAMYSDDCVYAIDGAAPVVGKAALRAMEQRGMTTGEVVRARHRVEALRVDGDLAYELGEVEGEVAPSGQPAQHVVFHFVALWRRNGEGAWQLAHLVGQVEAAPAFREATDPDYRGS